MSLELPEEEKTRKQQNKSKESTKISIIETHRSVYKVFR